MRDFIYIRDAIEFAQNSFRFQNPPWKPDSPEEIAKIEVEIGSSLPDAFIEYCLSFGTSGHQIFGTQYSLGLMERYTNDRWEEDSIKYYNKFIQILQNKYPEYLHTPIFEYSNHDGYVNNCFLLNGDADPLCLTYVEEEDVVLEGRFSQFLVDSLKQYEEYEPNHQERKEHPDVYR